MMDWHDGWGTGGAPVLMWLLMLLFWAALIVLIVWLVARLLPRSGPGEGAKKPAGPAESPEQILDRMFAVGEIDEETYRSRRTALAEMRGRP